MNESVRMIFAQRLRQARTRAMLSMDELCRRMDGAVSRQAIFKYENGEMFPDSTRLIKFAHVLGQSPDFFVRPITFDINNADISFRKKASIGVKEENAMKMAIQDDVERFMELDEILSCEHKEFDPIEPINSTLSTPDDMVDCAQLVRRKWKLGLAPISNVQLLLEEHGIKVIRTECARGLEGVSAKVNGRPLIVLNNNVLHTERQRLTALHELAHILYNDHIDKGITKNDKERLCHAFANEMLLPTDVVNNYFRGKRRISFDELVFIQKIYGISIDAIMKKLRCMDIVTEKRYKSFCIRKNCDEAFKQDVERTLFTEQTVDNFKTKVYRALAQTLITESKAASLLNEPIEQVHKTLISI